MWTLREDEHKVVAKRIQELFAGSMIVRGQPIASSSGPCRAPVRRPCSWLRRARPPALVRVSERAIRALSSWVFFSSSAAWRSSSAIGVGTSVAGRLAGHFFGFGGFLLECLDGLFENMACARRRSPALSRASRASRTGKAFLTLRCAHRVPGLKSHGAIVIVGQLDQNVLKRSDRLWRGRANAPMALDRRACG